jgi:hypothetical protein
MVNGGRLHRATDYEPRHVVAAESVIVELYQILAEKFASPEHFGPDAVVRFLDPADPDARAFVARDAYERVQALLMAAGASEGKT